MEAADSDIVIWRHSHTSRSASQPLAGLHLTESAYSLRKDRTKLDRQMIMPYH